MTAGAPLRVVGVPALCGDDGVDGTTLRYLLKKSLALKKKEEQEEGGEASGRFGTFLCAGRRAAGLRVHPLRPARRGGRKRGRRRRHFLKLARGFSVLAPRLLVFTVRHRRARQALAASKLSRLLRQLRRRRKSPCACLPTVGTTTLVLSRPTSTQKKFCRVSGCQLISRPLHR